MPSVSIRRAEVSDAPALGALHVASWRAAYKGLLPDEVIEGFTVESRVASWTSWLTSPTTPSHRHHVLTLDGVIAGFAVTGPSRDTSDQGEMELLAIYLAPDAWGRGHGAALLGVALGAAAGLGARTITAWVLDTNARARRFYEAMGFALDGAEKLDARIGDAREVRYRFVLG